MFFSNDSSTIGLVFNSSIDVIIIFSFSSGLLACISFISSLLLIGIESIFSCSFLLFLLIFIKLNNFLNMFDKLTLNVKTDAKIPSKTKITIVPVLPNKP